VAHLLYEFPASRACRDRGPDRTDVSTDEMIMKRRTLLSHAPVRLRLAAGCLLAIAAFGAAGCEQAVQTAPTSSVLTITANGAGVDLNGAVPIVATLVTQAGKAVTDGTLVAFTTTLGRMEPPEARVTNGRATVQLLGGAVSGIATVSATSGGVLSNSLEVRVGAVPTRVALNATIGSYGTSTLVATVYDARGVALPGVPVTFTTTAGSLASAIVYSDAQGQATTTIYCQSEATVTATASGVQSNIIVRPGGFGALAVNIAVNPSTPTRRQTVTFTASTTATCGTTGTCIARYEWEWSDGYLLTTTGNTTSRTFEVFGNYAVICRAYGIDGSVGSSRVEFFVN
jgi:hypothetical protein